MHNLLTTCEARLARAAGPKGAADGVGAASSAASADQGHLAQILDEYLAALERGEPIAPDELLARHPDVADRLRGYLSGLAIFHRAALPPAMIKAGGVETEQRGQEQHGPEQRGPELRGQLGDFRLVREIGRGGMGVVYEAEQMSLGRRVALKVLPATAAIDEKQITRFKNEAQAAAQIDHPHIVPVFAIGQELGIHYFAMQLIGGESLGEVIDRLRAEEQGSVAVSMQSEETAPRDGIAIYDSMLTMDEHRRLRFVAEMGVQIAEALHAAHEIGVVHRDVKPSNLLLDEKGKVWITDFGVARCKTSSDLTETGHAVGTMAYMSPEQAEGQAALVDHRTDVYSLGVTLYELATLHHPGEGPADTVTAFEYDRSNWRPPRFWNWSIPVDLEVILLKALSEAREERYATACELAEDLTRFLEGRPIVARPPTISAKLARWAKRHQRAVLAGVGMLALAVAGLAISLAIIAAERDERAKAYERATANHVRAEDLLKKERGRYAQAREMLDRVGAGTVQRLAEGVPGAEGVRKELLEEMLPYYQAFAREAANDPDLQADVALTHAQIGQLSEQLGAIAEAEQSYEQAQTIFERLATTDPTAQEHRRNLALCCNNLGQLLQRRGAAEAAHLQFERAHAIQKQLLRESPAAAEFRADLATTHDNLGLFLFQSGKGREASGQYRAAIEIHEALLRERPDDAATRQRLAATYNNLSSVFAAAEPEIARQWVERALVLQLRVAKEHPKQRAYQSDLALSYHNLGTLLARLGRRDDAGKCFQDAIAIRTRLVAAAPLVSAFRRDLAVSFNNLGMAQVSRGELAAAESSFSKALEIQQRLAGEHPNDAGVLSRLGGIYNNVGTARQQDGRLVEACTAFEQAIAVQRRAFESAPEVDVIRQSLSKHYYNYAAALVALDRPAEAAAVAVARRELWLDDAEGLLRVAEELAATCKRLQLGAVRRKFVRETAVTLQLAEEAGLEQRPDLKKAPFEVLTQAVEASGVTAVP